MATELKLRRGTPDGNNLISYRSSTNTIYIHNGFTSTITDSFSAPAGVSLVYDMEYIPQL